MIRVSWMNQGRGTCAFCMCTHAWLCFSKVWNYNKSRLHSSRGVRLDRRFGKALIDML